MSEFECSRGHLMKPSDGLFCPECGSRVARMDGKTDRQLEAEEKEYDRMVEEELMPWDDFREEEEDE